MRFFSCGVEEKQATETKINGVVGQTGKNRPMTPSPRKINPMLVSRNILTFNASPYLVFNYDDEDFIPSVYTRNK
ncbi:MAG: hypothetical protein FD179_1751 [Erysipelotrichaceae bacterium]|nr:MAG: hypothetical protein FD179_1751 [Erysipelotrichaceae bacterium]